MKAKIITEDYAEHLERALNDFLEENKNIEIVSIMPHFTVIKDFYSTDPEREADHWQEYAIIILYK